MFYTKTSKPGPFYPGNKTTASSTKIFRSTTKLSYYHVIYMYYEMGHSYFLIYKTAFIFVIMQNLELYVERLTLASMWII